MALGLSGRSVSTYGSENMKHQQSGIFIKLNTCGANLWRCMSGVALASAYALLAALPVMADSKKKAFCTVVPHDYRQPIQRGHCIINSANGKTIVRMQDGVYVFPDHQRNKSYHRHDRDEGIWFHSPDKFSLVARWNAGSDGCIVDKSWSEGGPVLKKSAVVPSF